MLLHEWTKCIRDGCYFFPCARHSKYAFTGEVYAIVQICSYRFASCQIFIHVDHQCQAYFVVLNEMNYSCTFLKFHLNSFSWDEIFQFSLFESDFPEISNQIASSQ